jgi:hypothetical protein
MRLSDESLRGRTVQRRRQCDQCSRSRSSAAPDWRVSRSTSVAKDIADRISASRTLLHRGTIRLPVSFADPSAMLRTLGRCRELREAIAHPSATWYCLKHVIGIRCRLSHGRGELLVGHAGADGPDAREVAESSPSGVTIAPKAPRRSVLVMVAVQGSPGNASTFNDGHRSQHPRPRPDCT